jgi:DNA-binding response OmpR family regulator
MMNPHPPLPPDHKRIIVIDIESDSRKRLVEHLALSGFDVTSVGSALEFYQSISTHQYLLAILDIGLPDQNGLVIAAYLRNNTDMRIIVLTAQSELEKRIAAYHSGADIYLSKQVDFSELSAALYSIVARLDKTLDIRQRVNNADPAKEIKPVPWMLRSDWVLSTPKGDDIKLTSKEFDIMHMLAVSPETLVTRRDLLHALAYEENEQGNRSLDALVHRLRHRSKKLNYRIPIKTAHAKGYCFSEFINIVYA